MIDLYTFGTPNGRKASVMLEEVELGYEVHVIDIMNGDQFQPEFVTINPNAKIPAILDTEGPDGDPMMVFESGAILIYLAEKTGSNLLPADMRKRYSAIQWLMFQVGGVGPMFGQAHHFLEFAKVGIPYAQERYGKETERLYGVMDRRLGEAAYLAGDFYSIADIATYPWVSRHPLHLGPLDEFPNVKRWYDEISARPAVQRGMKVPEG